MTLFARHFEVRALGSRHFGIPVTVVYVGVINSGI
jgi:hypothetical protein